jgi:hypothetical protein
MATSNHSSIPNPKVCSSIFVVTNPPSNPRHSPNFEVEWVTRDGWVADETRVGFGFVTRTYFWIWYNRSITSVTRTLPCVTLGTLRCCIKAQQPLRTQPYSPDKVTKNIHRGSSSPICCRSQAFEDKRSKMRSMV